MRRRASSTASAPSPGPADPAPRGPPPEGGTAVVVDLVERGYRTGPPPIAPDATVRLDPRRSDEELMAGMARNRRRNVRRSLAAFTIGLESDVEAFHMLHCASAARQGFTPIARDVLDSQWWRLAEAGACHLLIARRGGLPAAGLWLTSFAGTVTCKLSGWDASIEAARDANDALYWAGIGLTRSLSGHTYDLGGLDRPVATALLSGAPLPDDFHRTPAYFKVGFGGSVVVFPPVFANVVAPVLGAPATALLSRGFRDPRVPGLVYRFRNGRIGRPTGLR